MSAEAERLKQSIAFDAARLANITAMGERPIRPPEDGELMLAHVTIKNKETRRVFRVIKVPYRSNYLITSHAEDSYSSHPPTMTSWTEIIERVTQRDYPIVRRVEYFTVPDETIDYEEK